MLNIDFEKMSYDDALVLVNEHRDKVAADTPLFEKLAQSQVKTDLGKILAHPAVWMGLGGAGLGGIGAMLAERRKPKRRQRKAVAGMTGALLGLLAGGGGGLALGEFLEGAPPSKQTWLHKAYNRATGGQGLNPLGHAWEGLTGEHTTTRNLGRAGAAAAGISGLASTRGGMRSLVGGNVPKGFDAALAKGTGPLVQAEIEAMRRGTTTPVMGGKPVRFGGIRASGWYPRWMPFSAERTAMNAVRGSDTQIANAARANQTLLGRLGRGGGRATAALIAANLLSNAIHGQNPYQ